MNREEVIRKVTKSEDKLIVSKVLDRFFLSEKTNKLTITDFLDPHLQSVVSKCLEAGNVENYLFYGGYDGAERAIVAFCPSNMSENREPELAGLFKAIKISLIHRENITHRDYLGSLMGLGIKREKIGDILVKDEHCLVIVHNDIADFIRYNLDKVGNVRVQVEYIDIENLKAYEPKVKDIRTTVASLRLDSIASAGFGISRSKVANFIRAEKVNLNWETTPSLTKLVKEGDVISIRGRGRVVLQEIGKTTRKDRISVYLKKFI